MGLPAPPSKNPELTEDNKSETPSPPTSGGTGGDPGMAWEDSTVAPIALPRRASISWTTSRYTGVFTHEDNPER
jgi:hypothetical protein